MAAFPFPKRFGDMQMLQLDNAAMLSLLAVVVAKETN